MENFSSINLLNPTLNNGYNPGIWGVSGILVKC